MKKTIKIWSLLLIAILIMACDDSFLDTAPLDALSEETFFNGAADLKTYINGEYANLPRSDYGAGLAGFSNVDLDANSDVMIFQSSITGNLNRISASGVASATSNAWNTGYDRIRRVNYFLGNLDKIDRTDAIANQYIGEGYFFRAWHYFSLLQNFGGVPYITEALNIDDEEELFRDRDSRHIVAMNILTDLDEAIANLEWKGEGAAGESGRVNKEAAIVFKARVALYEGTWEHYHAANGTPFRVEGNNGNDLLALIEPAINILIEKQGATIFREGGPLNEPYNQLQAQNDASNTDGVFLYRVYDPVLLGRSHNFYAKADATGYAITKRLVDLYLDKNGVPQSLSTESFANLTEMGQNLEPRFRQTIWTPDRGPMTDIIGRTAQTSFSLRYPLIRPGVGDTFTSTGIRNWKGAVLDAAQYRFGEVDEVFIRYAIGLLALAEAKAILGTITQADIDKTVNVLRSRVGTPAMNLSTLEAWAIIYDEKEGFDASASNIINEIRRERSIELALEGFRLDDLKRWAVYDKVINGYKPTGVGIQEFVDYFNTPENTAADGWNNNVDPSFIIGVDTDVTSEGLINPYFKDTQFDPSGDGFYIDPNRDYLNFLPVGQIDLYRKNGYTLQQNPGWL